MDNLLRQFEVCLNSPESYLDGSVELRNSCLNLNEELFSYCHDKSGRFPTGPLCTLHTKGFDNEQVWEQIQLLNEPTIKCAKKKIQEIANMKIPQAQGDSDKAELLNDEEYSEGSEEECDHHFPDDSEVTSRQSPKGQDLFFNLSEMNKFLQDEDRKYENRLDSKQNGDDDIDLFREMSSEEEDLMYEDFFDSPNDYKDDGDEESDNEEEASSEQAMDETGEQQLSDNDDDAVGNNQLLSSHQKQQQKVAIHIYNVFIVDLCSL